MSEKNDSFGTEANEKSNYNCNEKSNEFTWFDTHYESICDFCLKKYQCENDDKDLVLTCKYYESCLKD